MIKYNFILLLTIFIIFPATGCDTGSNENKLSSQEVWPNYSRLPSYKSAADNAIIDYLARGFDYAPYLQNYTTDGDYLNYGKTISYEESDLVHLDNNGVPLVKYGQNYFYNPVTVSEYALHVYGKYLRGEATIDSFLKATERLMSMQDNVGAFRYPFSYNYYLTNQSFPPGWVSGMAQGLGLSVLSRAYRTTGDKRYLIAGDSALRFLTVPVSSGGPLGNLKDLHPSLSAHITFEEYPVEPASFTLNGFMYTLLGVYDWWQLGIKENLESRPLSENLFSRGLDSLTNMLPYYDIGGFTAYDLGHIIYGKAPHIGVDYHSVHIYLLHALYSVTFIENLKQTELLWASYVNIPKPLPATAVFIVPDKASPQNSGTTVSFLAFASGGSGIYGYQFWLKKDTGTWSVVQPYSLSSSWTWDTKASQPGKYYVSVYARSVGSSASYEAVNDVAFDVTSPPATGVTLTATPMSPALTP